MKKYIRAPIVLPGLLLVAGGIIASIFIRNIENNMVYMLASMGCALLCLIGISPTLNYINNARKK